MIEHILSYKPEKDAPPPHPLKRVSVLHVILQTMSVCLESSIELQRAINHTLYLTHVLIIEWIGERINEPTNDGYIDELVSKYISEYLYIQPYVLHPLLQKLKYCVFYSLGHFNVLIVKHLTYIQNKPK